MHISAGLVIRGTSQYLELLLEMSALIMVLIHDWQRQFAHQTGPDTLSMNFWKANASVQTFSETTGNKLFLIYNEITLDLYDLKDLNNQEAILE